MRTVAEFGRLASEAARLWWRFLPQLCFWLLIGQTTNVLAGHASTAIGADHKVFGTMVIILGIVSWVACLVLAIHSMGTGLTDVDQDPDEPRIGVLLGALGPFMAVYAAWGLAEEQFDQLIQANLSTFGIDADLFSVNASDWWFFLWFGIGAWVVRMLVRILRGRRRPSRVAALVGLYADAAFIFSSFFVLRALAGQFFEWLNGRVVWRWLQTGWDGFVQLMPEIPVWFEVSLPEGLRLLGERLWDFVIPGFGNAVLLPLMWIALAATVFGRGGETPQDLVRGTVLERHATRLGTGWDHPVRQLWRWATADLREKYLPMLGALRLLSRSGARFVGAYLVLVTSISVVGNLVDRGTQYLIGPQPLPITLFYAPTQNLIVAVLTTSWLLATYAATLNRAIPAARSEAQVRDGARSNEAESRI